MTYQAHALAALGYLRLAQADAAAALPPLEESLAMARRVYGDASTVVGGRLTKVAEALHAMGDFAAEEVRLREAIALRRELLGSHPALAWNLYCLAKVRRIAGDDAEAEALLRESLAIQRAARGDHHTDVADCLHALGALLSARGDDASAEPFFDEAWTIQLDLLGPEHDETRASEPALTGARARLRGAPADGHD